MWGDSSGVVIWTRDRTRGRTVGQVNLVASRRAQAHCRKAVHVQPGRVHAERARCVQPATRLRAAELQILKRRILHNMTADVEQECGLRERWHGTNRTAAHSKTATTANPQPSAH